MRFIYSFLCLLLLQAASLVHSSEDLPATEASSFETSFECSLALRLVKSTIVGSDDFCALEGAKLHASTEGVDNVGSLSPGSWVAVSVEAPRAAVYGISVRVASAVGHGAFEITNKMTGHVYKTVNAIASTGGWHAWETVNIGQIALPEGQTTLQITSTEAGWNLLSLEFTLLEIPETFEYMVYDSHITRDNGEKLSQQNLAHTYSGEELAFDLKVHLTGKYAMYAKISNPADLGSFSILSRETSQLHATVNSVPPTDGWDKTTTFLVGEVELSAGNNPLALLVTDGQWHLDYFGVNLMEATDVGNNPAHMVQARQFTASQGLGIDQANKNLGDIDTGDWVEYNLNIKEAGSYLFHFFVASPEGTGSFEIINGQTLEIYGEVSSFPSTGGWFDWEAVAVENVNLAQGEVTLRLAITNGGFNFYGFSFQKKNVDEEEKKDKEKTEATGSDESWGSCGTSSVPALPTPAGEAITISAEGLCALEGATLNPSTEGPPHAGNFHEGHWVAFDVNLEAPGDYDVKVHVSSFAGEGAFSISDKQTGTVYATVDTLLPTGGWQNWQTMSAGTFSLPAGQSTLRLMSDQGGWNLLSIELMVRVDHEKDNEVEVDLKGCGPSSEQPTLPTTAGATTIISTDRLCELDGAALEPAPEGGPYVGVLDQGNWIAFDVNLEAPASYDVRVHLSSVSGDGAFTISDKQTNLVYKIVDTLPLTGGWTSWQPMDAGLISLPAGHSTLKLTSGQSGWNLLLIELIARDASEDEEHAGDVDSEGGSESENEVTVEGCGGTALQTFLPKVAGAATIVSALEFCALEGAELEPSSEGDPHIGYLQDGHWVAFDVNAEVPMSYYVKVFLSSFGGEGGFSISNKQTGTVYLTVDSVTNTGGWQTWDIMDVGEINLPSGITTLQLTSSQGGWNLLWVELVGKEALPENEHGGDVGGDAEDEDGDEEGETEKDEESGDVEEGGMDTSKDEVGEEEAPAIPESFDFMVFDSDITRENGEKLSQQNLAHTYNGDTLAFDLTVEQPGLYAMYAKISNPADLGAFVIINRETSQLQAVANPVPATEGWDKTTTFFVGELLLSGGTNPLGLHIIEGQWHLDYFGISFLQSEDVGNGPNRYMVQARSFFASEGVEVDGANKNVGKIDAGDWIEYNLNIMDSGSYWFHFFVASPDGAGSFDVVNGQTLEIYGEASSFPSTGGWFDLQPVAVNGIDLEAGEVTLRLSVTNGGFNFFGFSYGRYFEDDRGGDDYQDHVHKEPNGDEDYKEPDGEDHSDEEEEQSNSNEEGEAQNDETENDEVGDESEEGCGNGSAQALPSAAGATAAISVDQLCALEGASLFPSNEGGPHVGYLQDGHWVAFDVSLETPGLYDVKLRLSSFSGEGGFSISNKQTGTVYTTVDSVMNTGGWQNWQVLDGGVITLPSGRTTLQLTSSQGGWNLLAIELVAKGTIEHEGEEMDAGKEGDASEAAPTIPDSFDFMVYDSDITRDNGEKLSQQNLAHTYNGDELAFDLTVEQSGRYAMYAKISNPADLGSFAIINRETSQLQAIANSVPATEGWDKTTTFLVGELLLSAGTNPLDLLIIEGQWHLDYFGVSLLESADVGSGPSRYMVQARSFSASEGVEVDGANKNLGKIDSGDWVEYKVNIMEPGSYLFHFFVASPEGTGSFDIVHAQTLEIQGEASSFPSTSGWFDWDSVSVAGIELEAGEVTLRLSVTDGGFNFFGLSYELANRI